MKNYRLLTKLEDFEAYRPTARQLAAARARKYDEHVTLTRGQTILSWT